MLLPFLLLGTSRARLGAIMELNQATTSFRLGISEELLVGFMLGGGTLSPWDIRRAASKAGLDPLFITGIIAFVLLGDYTTAAAICGMTRPGLRRAISEALKDILDARGNPVREGTDAEVVAFGAWLSHLVDSHNPEGTGKAKRLSRRARVLYRVDPGCRRSFRMNVADEGFGKMFIAQSAFFEGHDGDGIIG